MRPRLTAEELDLGRELRSSMPSFMRTPTPTTVTLLDVRILLANDALLRLLGRPRHDVLGRSAQEYLVPDERLAIERRQWEMGPDRFEPPGASGTGTYEWAYTVQRPGGDEVRVRTSTLVIRSSSGEPVAMLTRVMPVAPAAMTGHHISTVLDETDRRVLEAALAAIPNFDALPEATLIISPRGRLLCVNAAFTAAYGWSDAEVAGLPGADILAPHQVSWADERMREITGATVLPPPSNPVVRHRDGRAIESRASSIPVRTDSGEVHYIVGTVAPHRPAAASRSGTGLIP